MSTANMETSAGTLKQLRLSFEAALEKLPGVLAAEGFGVVAQVDVQLDIQQTLKQTLGVDFRRYRIIRLYHHAFAQQTPNIDFSPIGRLPPSNLVLFECDDGQALLSAVEPLQALTGQHAHGLEALVKTVSENLQRVLAAM